MVQKSNKKLTFYVDIIVISKLIETKNNCKYLTRYLHKIIRPLVLILPEMGGYVTVFKNKDGDKGRNKNEINVSIQMMINYQKNILDLDCKLS